MTLPPHLVHAIESTHVAFEGLSHSLKLLAVDADPPPPQAPTGAVLTVETTHEGRSHTVSCVIPLSTLEDDRQVATTLAATMREALARERHDD